MKFFLREIIITLLTIAGITEAAEYNLYFKKDNNNNWQIVVFKDTKILFGTQLEKETADLRENSNVIAAVAIDPFKYTIRVLLSSQLQSDFKLVNFDEAFIVNVPNNIVGHDKLNETTIGGMKLMKWMEMELNDTSLNNFSVYCYLDESSNWQIALFEVGTSGSKSLTPFLNKQNESLKANSTFVANFKVLSDVYTLYVLNNPATKQKHFAVTENAEAFSQQIKNSSDTARLFENMDSSGNFLIDNIRKALNQFAADEARRKTLEKIEKEPTSETKSDETKTKEAEKNRTLSVYCFNKDNAWQLVMFTFEIDKYTPFLRADHTLYEKNEINQFEFASKRGEFEIYSNQKVVLFELQKSSTLTSIPVTITEKAYKNFASYGDSDLLFAAKFGYEKVTSIITKIREILGVKKTEAKVPETKTGTDSLLKLAHSFKILLNKQVA